MNQIWKRYFFVELMKIFSLIIVSIYFLYVLIDYSIHTKAFQSGEISFLEIVLYYACQFTKRGDVLIPVALMVATIKVLSTANLRHEIVALTAGGIPLKKILSPFLLAALFLSLFLFTNFQFIQPQSLNRIDAFEECYFKNRSVEKGNKKVNALVLEDNSLLIYQAYDQETRAFFDVFWLKECDQICRIHTLFPYEKIPLGKYVDTLSRTEEGEIVKVNSQEEAFFPEMHFDPKTLFSAVNPPRRQSISQLANQLKWKQTRFGLKKMNDREAASITFFYFKLLSPLACLFAVIGPAPFCLRFSRNLSVFMIYALSLFGLITYFTVMNSSVVLGESQIFPPACAILIPQTLIFLLLGWKYAKL